MQMNKSTNTCLVEFAHVALHFRETGYSTVFVLCIVSNSSFATKKINCHVVFTHFSRDKCFTEF